MKIEPVITEKTTELAKAGKYTFKLGVNTTKGQVKKLVNTMFGVDVVSVRTMRLKEEIKRSFSKRKKIVKPAKKAIVELKDKQKIDIFETKKK